MNLSQLIQPTPLLIPIILLVIMFLKYRKARRWPDTDKCLEIIAFSGGIYAASIMFFETIISYGENPTKAWMLFAGAIVTGLVSVKGTWVVLSSIKLRVEPHTISEELNINEENKIDSNSS